MPTDPTASLSVLLGVFLGVAGATSQVCAQAGTLDPSFDGDGVVLTPVDPSGSLYSFAVQADGKIVAVGQQRSSANINRWVVVRYLDDGSLDPAFGPAGGGVVFLFGAGYPESAYDVTIDPAGHIVVTGWRNSPATFTTVRLLDDGALDPSFGAGGIVETEIGTGAISRAVAVQPDGRIVVAGMAVNRRGDAAVALARYLDDGSLDTASFGQPARGKKKKTAPFTGVWVDAADKKYDRKVSRRLIALQADGKIVVGGYSAQYGQYDPNALWMVARYNADGSVDGTFGEDGKVFDNFGYRTAILRGIAVQADGRILGSGRGLPQSGTFDSLVARWNPDGSPDTTFGDGGLTGIGSPFETQAGDVAVQADGRIVICSSYYEPPVGWGIAYRFLTDGSPDVSFGVGGMSELSGGGIEGCVIDGSGRILIGGSVNWNGNGAFGLARFIQ